MNSKGDTNDTKFLQNKIPSQGNMKSSPSKERFLHYQNISLELFFPNFDNQLQPYFQENHKHKLDFYLMNKKDLIISMVKANVDPKTYEFLAQSFTNILKKNYIVYNKMNKGNVQVNLFACNDEKKYIIKKCWINYYSKTSNKKLREEAESFINQKYNEYVNMKIFANCPFSVIPLDFQLTYIDNEGDNQSSFLVTETLMTYGGEPLKKGNLSEDKILEEICEIFDQVAKAANVFECLNLEHNDLKPGNILFERAKNLDGKVVIKVRVIDFDIGKQKSITQTKKNCESIMGYSPTYVSPEIYQYINKIGSQKKFDSFKSQVYSIGLVILKLFGPDFLLTSNFDSNYKVNKENHKKLFEEIHKFMEKSKFPKGETDLFPKIMQIILYCISYNPEERPSANQLLTLLFKIMDKTITIKDIQYKYTNIMNELIGEKKIELSTLVNTLKSSGITKVYEEEEKETKHLNYNLSEYVSNLSGNDCIRNRNENPNIYQKEHLYRNNESIQNQIFINNYPPDKNDQYEKPEKVYVHKNHNIPEKEVTKEDYKQEILTPQLNDIADRTLLPANLQNNIENTILLNSNPGRFFQAQRQNNPYLLSIKNQPRKKK